MSYPWMSMREIDRYMEDIVRLKVSVVARSPRGFLTYYKNNTAHPSDYWIRRRRNFIARHLPQYNTDRSYRHYLSLIAWAYKPSKNPLNNIK
jgi:hypothetical protein